MTIDNLAMQNKFKELPRLLEQNQFEEAEPLFDQYISGRAAEDIGFPNLISYGRLKFQRQKFSDAEKAALLAISLDEMRVEAPELLLEVYIKQKLYKKALKVADALLKAVPDSLEYKTNRLTVLSFINDSDQMLSSWKDVCTQHPEVVDMPSVQHSVLNALVSDGRFEEANEYYLQFKQTNHQWNTWLALSEPHIQTGLGHFDKAIESLTESIAMDPENIVWRWNRGLVRLAKGDLQGGWEDYGCRWSWSDFPSPKRELDISPWEGQDLAGKSIIISAEQGLGDQIMFSVVIASVIKMNPETIRLEVQEKIVPLFQIWYPECEVAAWKNDRKIDAELESNFDYHSPMATVVSRLMDTRAAIEKLPRRHLRLSEQEKSMLVGSKLANYPIKVGLSWRSSAIDGDRITGYMSVALCEKIIESLPSEVGFVIVQYKFEESERQLLSKYPNVFIPEEDLYEDVLLNAKYCACCDVVVSAPTAVAQLCGIFGVPCITWSTHQSWVSLGFDSPPWFGNLLTIPHKINMSKAAMATKIVNILKSSISQYFNSKRPAAG